MTLHRHKDQSVKIIDDASGDLLVTIPREAWDEIGAFFAEISHPQAML